MGRTKNYASSSACSSISSIALSDATRTGRPSIAPEKLLRTLLLQVLYTVRSERLLMEQLDYNLLFRWFVGLEMDDPVWNPTVFTKNRERLLAGDVAHAFFDRVVTHARERGLLSDEHFTVDGTLVAAWASVKSFHRKDVSPPRPDDPGNPTVNFRGDRRRNETHASTTDPDARLARKGDGQEAKLFYSGHVLMDNRHGLAGDGLRTLQAGWSNSLAAGSSRPSTSRSNRCSDSSIVKSSPSSRPRSRARGRARCISRS